MSKNSAFKNGIVILGAGNVATHLALALLKSGFIIKSVYSRTIESAKELALKVNSDYTNKINEIPKDADFYLIAVKDDAINTLIRELNVNKGIVVHTAGSVSINIFRNQILNYGVLYPLQTFTKKRVINFYEVPICIEANNSFSEDRIFQIAQLLGKNVYKVDSENRKIIHLAAVFACNFVNHMFTISSTLMKKSDNTFDLLKPLIIETVNKAIDLSPEKAQTGPALRNDREIIQNHLNMLEDYPEFEKIYRLVSESIFKTNMKKN